ncbi:MAG: hypothetical protein PVG89_10300 [Gammaproteobacteria bacterium]|jgi:hypothetical protein
MIAVQWNMKDMRMPKLSFTIPVTFFVLSCALFIAPVNALAAKVQETRNPQTGLYTWKVEQQGFSIELIQLLPDMVKAVYSSRGLPQRIIDSMKGYCVFGTIIRNTIDEPVSYRVADWRYIAPGGETHPVKTKSQWVKEWEAMGVSYRWSILADDQTFQPGDWIQGMTTIKLPPESRLDLVYTWRIGDELHQNTIKGLRCAPATAPEL